MLSLTQAKMPSFSEPSLDDRHTLIPLDTDVPQVSKLLQAALSQTQKETWSTRHSMLVWPRNTNHMASNCPSHVFDVRPRV